jgi:class 3 adenylate cyclase
MPYFLDRHEMRGVSAEEVARLHLQDLAGQGKYDVNYLTYWFDYDRQAAFCLVDAPSPDAAEAVHREAHGLMPYKIISVDPEEVGRFLGRFPDEPPGEPYVASAFRAILFTDIVGSTELTHWLGDARAMEVIRRHDATVERALRSFGGRKVKHTGDGVMASFASVAAAVECAMEIQRSLGEDPMSDADVHIRIGLAAGEPVTENDDLFGAAVQLAARLCDAAEPDGILVSTAVFELSVGKRFPFSGERELRLKGFQEPVRAYAVAWEALPGGR